MTNIYWPVYKNLESEIEKLMFSIHIDNKQLSVYSSKIADMILRAATEIESISKDLYQQNDDSGKERKTIKYDYDAIKLLEKKWILSKKVIIISHHNYHGLNKKLYPFEKNEKRTDKLQQVKDNTGTRTFGWNNAYQNLKHDRSQSIEFGSIGYLFNIMSALFILNIYYKNEIFDLGNDSSGLQFNANLGSKIFSVKLHLNSEISTDDSYNKQSDFEECIYLSHPTKETFEIAKIALNEMNKKRIELSKEEILNIIKNEFTGKIISPNSIENKANEIIKEQLKDDELILQAARQTNLKSKMEQLRYEVVLNKNQID